VAATTCKTCEYDEWKVCAILIMQLFLSATDQNHNVGIQIDDDKTDDSAKTSNSAAEKEFSLGLFSIIFCVYLCVGAIALAFTSSNITLLDAVYTNFRALTADFAEIAPDRLTSFFI
jgi:hypothetical protein